MYKITFEDILIFLTVGECLNFSEASRQLYITQPAVTKRIHHLEKELGFSLFHRNSRTVTLTQEGSLLLTKWKPLHTEFLRSIEEIKLQSQKQTKTIHIGILYGMRFETLVFQIADAFQKKHPDMNITIQIYNFKEMNEKAEELDILFTDALEVEHLTDMETAVISEPDMLVALSVDHPLAKKSSLHLKDCSKESFFVFSRETTPAAITYITNACEAIGFTPNIIPVDNIPSQHMCIKMNQGIGIVPEHSTIESDSSIVLKKCKDLNLTLKKVCCWKTNCKHPLISEFVQSILSNQKESSKNKLPY